MPESGDLRTRTGLQYEIEAMWHDSDRCRRSQAVKSRDVVYGVVV
jgi:hypothetical protein